MSHNRSMSVDETVSVRPGLRERKKARTRATLRREAFRLFREQGYGDTTIEQIAEASDVSPSTFFRYFPTKEDVVLADDIDPIVLQVLADQPADLPPMQAIRLAVAAVFEQLTPEDIDREVERQRLVYAVPELRQAMMTLLYRSIDMIASAVAARLGRSPDDFEVRVFAGAVAGAVLGGAVPGGATGPQVGPDGTFDGAIKAIEFLAAGLPLT